MQVSEWSSVGHMDTVLDRSDVSDAHAQDTGDGGHMDHILVFKYCKERMKLKDMEKGLCSIPGGPFETPWER